MDIEGAFLADQQEIHIGDPVSVTLVVKNKNSEPIYMLIPRARANGLQIEVKPLTGVRIQDMTNEPDVGLLAENELRPGATYRQRFIVSQWVQFTRPGQYSIKYKIDVEAYRASLKERNQGAMPVNIPISTEVNLEVLEKLP
jgi:hypothetical protein